MGVLGCKKSISCPLKTHTYTFLDVFFNNFFKKLYPSSKYNSKLTTSMNHENILQQSFIFSSSKKKKDPHIISGTYISVYQSECKHCTFFKPPLGVWHSTGHKICISWTLVNQAHLFCYYLKLPKWQRQVLSHTFCEFSNSWVQLSTHFLAHIKMENIATKKTLEFSIHAAVATQRLWCNLLLMELTPTIPHKRNDFNPLQCHHRTGQRHQK